MHLLPVVAFGQDNPDSITISGKVEVVVDTSGLFYSPPNPNKNDPMYFGVLRWS